jgi:hypothetical protein
MAGAQGKSACVRVVCACVRARVRACLRRAHTSLSEAPARPKKATFVTLMMLLMRPASSSWLDSATPADMGSLWWPRGGAAKAASQGETATGSSCRRGSRQWTSTHQHTPARTSTHQHAPAHTSTLHHASTRRSAHASTRRHTSARASTHRTPLPLTSGWRAACLPPRTRAAAPPPARA